MGRKNENKIQYKMNTYTRDEINKALETLNNKLEELKLRRTEITKAINNVKKNIKYYEELDERQTKIF